MNCIIGIVLGTAFLMIIALYCELIIAGRSEEASSRQNNEGYDSTFWKKQTCPKCKVGKESYELDRHSDTCPYIGCWENGKCPFYVPLDKPQKSFLKTYSKVQSVCMPDKKG